jgi:hypothetical protein
LNALFIPAAWTRKYTIHTSANFERSKNQKIVAKVLVTCELTIFGLGSHSATGEEWADDDNAGTSVLTLKPGSANRTIIRSFCADLAAIFRAVEFRDIEAGLSCIMGIGSDAWDLLFGAPRPAELHPFREIRAGARHASSTPGDLLFHVRAKRMDLCFEMATQIMA